MQEIIFKNCPFCGSGKIEKCKTNDDALWVRCYMCGADAEYADNKEEAARNWNRRANDSEDQLIPQAYVVDEDYDDW